MVKVELKVDELDGVVVGGVNVDLLLFVVCIIHITEKIKGRTLLEMCKSCGLHKKDCLRRHQLIENEERGDARC